MEPRVCGLCGELPLFWEVEMGLASAVHHPAWLGPGGLGEGAHGWDVISLLVCAGALATACQQMGIPASLGDSTARAEGHFPGSLFKMEWY